MSGMESDPIAFSMDSSDEKDSASEDASPSFPHSRERLFSMLQKGDQVAMAKSAPPTSTETQTSYAEEFVEHGGKFSLTLTPPRASVAATATTLLMDQRMMAERLALWAKHQKSHAQLMPNALDKSNQAESHGAMPSSLGSGGTSNHIVGASHRIMGDADNATAVPAQCTTKQWSMWR